MVSNRQNSSPTPAQQTSTIFPPAQEISAGIWKITLPIPFPLKTVNVYALVGKTGWTLIDTGMGTPAAREAFTAGLKKANLNIAHLQSIVLTHHHPDHIGLSGELQEQSGARVYMHPIDEQTLHFIWSETTPRRFSAVSNFFRQHGMEPTTPTLTETPPPDPKAMRAVLRVPPHEAFTLVEDGETLEIAGERYEVFWVPGHSDGLIALFRRRDGVFLAADHVLPRITPNIGLYSTHDRPNPLGDYLNSLSKVANLPASIVLPGHGEPFTHLHERTDEISAHHAERLHHILQLLAPEPRSAYAITCQLFASRLKSDDALRMAFAEVLAHLEYLRFTGKVAQKLVADERILYTLV
ncbi:MAG TPA: MBL fold metallo-hydrolase [Ktedonobacteraceae bacterium]|jgi:glyoxylase-like metal-dependent hydrolase (beta-lactamase superfamily II)|nr:MBL fold metallo-hydrolase [Ktedonobacteraceae bacterium]